MQPLTASDWQNLYSAARQDAKRLSTASLAVPLTAEQWTDTQQRRRQQWLEMLGLDPLPKRTPLKATVTGILDRGDYTVEKVHFQSMPGAYVIGNLYRPTVVKEPLPTILYLCGHSKGKVNPPYQANPRWFAQHGYVALVLDPIQLGESQGFHHGTYNGGRWDWQSRGYTPAGTEVWNAMRALDYLTSRPDVDAERFGVTGLSGGGVISWCLGAADERVKVIVPVCQSGSIWQVVTDRGTDGHCDCAFWINYHRWCWPDIGSLIAPRALLIASGSEDVLWRPSGYRDVAQRIRRQYAQLDANDNFEIVEDATPHGYTPKLRRAIFTWFNTHLKGDDRPVQDDVTDVVEPEENLLVFGGTPPVGDAMAQIDKKLVRAAPLPEFNDAEAWSAYQAAAIKRLGESTFRHTQPSGPPRQIDFRNDGSDARGRYGTFEFASSDDILLAARATWPLSRAAPSPMLAFALPEDAEKSFTGGGRSRPGVSRDLSTLAVEVRNTAATSVGPGYLWTLRRTYPILGHTLAERQVADLLSGLALMRSNEPEARLSVYGAGSTAPLAIYAALLDPQISEVVLQDCPSSHENPQTAQFLGVLRIGDLPHNLALLYPRKITFVGEIPKAFEWTKKIYEQFGAGSRIREVSSIAGWRPE